VWDPLVRGALQVEHLLSEIVTMSGPPPAFKGDLTWEMSSLVSAWIVGPLYGTS
jgi:hypothetical protein